MNALASMIPVDIPAGPVRWREPMGAMPCTHAASALARCSRKRCQLMSHAFKPASPSPRRRASPSEQSRAPDASGPRLCHRGFVSVFLNRVSQIENRPHRPGNGGPQIHRKALWHGTGQMPQPGRAETPVLPLAARRPARCAGMGERHAAQGPASRAAPAPRRCGPAARHSTIDWDTRFFIIFR